MIDDRDVCLAVRARARSLAVLSVTDSFEATATGYARASGSFIDDGFEVGMEVSGSGWTNTANDEPKVVTDVSALALTTAGVGIDDATGFPQLSGDAGTTVESAASRTLKVGLPVVIDIENAKIVPGEGVPWWREEYSPGPGQRRSSGGPDSFVQQFADYILTLFLPSGCGPNAAHRYMAALRTHFPAGLVIGLTDANSSCRVRGDTAPFFGQPFQSVDPTPGFFTVPFTVPLELWTLNS